MQGASRLLVLVASLVLVGGCSSSRPRLLRVSADYAGASPRIVDDSLAYPIEMMLLRLPHVTSITSISSAGRLETYAVVAPGHSKEVLRDVVAALGRTVQPLPPAATPPTVEILPDTATIPDVRPTQVDYVVVHLDRKAIGRYGISVHDIRSAMQAQAAGSALDVSWLAKLRGTRVRNHQGAMMPLTELAEIRVEKAPSHIVRRRSFE